MWLHLMAQSSRSTFVLLRRGRCLKLQALSAKRDASPALQLLNNASVLSASPALIVCPGVAGIKCIKTPISGQRLVVHRGICMAAKCATGSRLPACLPHWMPAFVDFRVQRVQSLARPQDIEVLPAAVFFPLATICQQSNK